MSVEELRKLLDKPPDSIANSAELLRLQTFLKAMKDAGLTRPQIYEIPLPDTIGKSLAHKMKSMS